MGKLPNNPTVNDIAAAYLADLEAAYALAPKAYHAAKTRTHARTFCAMFGDLPAGDVGAPHLLEWAAAHPDWQAASTKDVGASFIRRIFFSAGFPLWKEAPRKPGRKPGKPPQTHWAVPDGPPGA